MHNNKDVLTDLISLRALCSVKTLETLEKLILKYQTLLDLEVLLDPCSLCGESIEYARAYGCPTAHPECKHETRKVLNESNPIL